MVDFNKILPLARIGVFGAVSFMSLIVLALSAHLISVTSGSYGYYYGFTALGIATAILSLATLPAMYVHILSLLVRENAFVQTPCLSQVLDCAEPTRRLPCLHRCGNCMALVPLDHVGCCGWIRIQLVGPQPLSLWSVRRGPSRPGIRLPQLAPL